MQKQKAKKDRAFLRHKERWKDCTDCSLGECANNHVFGRGPLPCDVLVIGEAPGHSEDMLGQPFVGASGRLLQEMFQSAQPEGVSFFITNTIACRPTDGSGKHWNRPPTKEEILSCRNRVAEIYRMAKPSRVLAVGKTALHALEDHYSEFIEVPVNSIYHPAYFLRRGGRNSKLYTDTVARLQAFLKGVKDEKTEEDKNRRPSPLAPVR